MKNNTSNYFDAQESRCKKLLNEFNDNLQWFKGITATTRGSETDFRCTDKKDRLTHVETKERKGTIEQFQKYGDVLIEPSKIAAMTRIMESGYTYNEQRLYINFVDDGVIIFNLNNISSMNFYPNHKQKNYGKGITEHEDRYGLKMKDAIIYIKEDNVYKKYNEDLS